MHEPEPLHAGDTLSGHIGNALQLVDLAGDLLEKRAADDDDAPLLARVRDLVASAQVRLNYAQALERRRDQAARLVSVAGSSAGNTMAALEDGRVFQFGWGSSGPLEAGSRGNWREVAPVPFTPAWVLAHLTNKTPARALDADATGVPHQGAV